MFARIANRATLLVLVGAAAGIAHLWVNAESDRPVQVGWKPRSAGAPIVVPTPPANAGGAGTEATPEPSAGPAAAPEPATAEPAAAPATAETTPPAPAAPDAEALPEGFITLAQAKALFDRADGTVYFVDARNDEEFRAGHVTGAMHVKPEALRGAPPRKVTDYLTQMTVVVYCGGGLCDASKNVAKYLEQMGIPGEVYVFEAGFPAWQAAYPDAVETGPDIYDLGG